jgi:two-component system sensor histidine kinase DesK
MTTLTSIISTVPLRRRAWWWLVAIHIPFVVFVVAQAGLGLALRAPSGPIALSLPLALAAAAIQLLHSAAAAAGARPRFWGLTLALLVAIAYLPAPIFRIQWTSLQWFVLASIFMLLRGKLAFWAGSVTAVAHCAWFAATSAGPNPTVASLAWLVSYWAAVQATGAVGLIGATWLVRLMDELHEARMELADLAVSRERLRITRDLHDLLGQSLTAVSLKGDLAIGVLERHDVPRAIGEIESLVAVARSALHDVLFLAHHEPPIALAAEIERAADLLGSSGTETRVDIGVDDLPPAVDALFAWALREGTTNVLRHSNATSCVIRIARHESGVRLEMVNDGALPMSPGGSGLIGLAARAAGVSARSYGRLTGTGSFRLTVDVPEVAA